jgi:HAD superfamily hydrolase (TIGR01549 family)
VNAPDPPPTASPLTAVLLDLDDTLVPWQTPAHWQWAWRPRGPVLSERHVRAALKRSLHQWDRRRWEILTGGAPPADDTAYRGFLGWTLTEIAGHPLAPDESKAVVDRFLKPAYESERFDDAALLLDALGRRGVRVGVLSQLPVESSRVALKRAGLPDSLLVPPSEGTPGIPAVAAFRAAAAHLGAKPRATLYVGDLFWSDVRAAARAGLLAVLMDRGDAAGRMTGSKVRSLSEVPGLLDRPPGDSPEPSDPGPASPAP